MRNLGKGSYRVSGGYTLEFAAMAFTVKHLHGVAETEDFPPLVSATQGFTVILAEYPPETRYEPRENMAVR